MRVFHDIGRLAGEVTLTPMSTVFGLQFTEFKFYKGLIRLVEHPLLTELATTGTTGMAIITDLTGIKLAYMDGRDVVRETFDGIKDGSNSGIDATGGGLLSEFATEFPAPPTFGIINGLTQGVL